MDHPKFDDKRLAEIRQEIEVLNAAVAGAAKERLGFDDEPAAFASLMERIAQAREEITPARTSGKP